MLVKDYFFKPLMSNFRIIVNTRECATLCLCLINFDFLKLNSVFAAINGCELYSNYIFTLHFIPFIVHSVKVNTRL